MNANICSAISSRAVITFHYKGGVRVVEPHCHGISTAGNEIFRAWQVSGYSESGEPTGWKIFSIARISTIIFTGQVFTSNRPDYNPNDLGMSSVHCHV